MAARLQYENEEENKGKKRGNTGENNPQERELRGSRGLNTKREREEQSRN